MSRDVYPRVDMSNKIEQIDRELRNSRSELLVLTSMLDRRTVDRNFNNAMKGLCEGGLFGLTLMMLASLVSAILLTLLVCVDSHTWIYLTKK